jgi:hypothetical protein
MLIVPCGYKKIVLNVGIKLFPSDPTNIFYFGDKKLNYHMNNKKISSLADIDKKIC